MDYSFTINGKHNKAKIFTKNVDSNTMEQIQNITNLEYLKDSKIRIMPDAHYGEGCVIGTTMTYTNKVCPNVVGVDIACGVTTYNLGKINVDVKAIDDFIIENISFGSQINDEVMPESKNFPFDSLKCARNIKLIPAKHGLGSLGGGNHFIETGKDSKGNIYLSIHSGSRNLGVQVASYYQEKGYKDAYKEAYNKEASRIIDKLKAENRTSEIEENLKKLKASFSVDFYPETMYVEGKNLEDYLHDVKITQRYAKLNRKIILDKIVHHFNYEIEDIIESVHNYIDTQSKIIRKGAISARDNEVIVIPMNMRDGILLCRGKGNSDWNYSAPHGAGRLMSRRDSKEKITMEMFRESTKDIYTSSIVKSNISEAPEVYKNAKEIMSYISDTVEILDIIKPIHNFKGGSLTSVKDFEPNTFYTSDKYKEDEKLGKMLFMMNHEGEYFYKFGREKRVKEWVMTKEEIFNTLYYKYE